MVSNSMIRYLDTHPKVRNYVLAKMTTETKDIRKTELDPDDFDLRDGKWVLVGRHLFLFEVLEKYFQALKKIPGKRFDVQGVATHLEITERVAQSFLLLMFVNGYLFRENEPKPGANFRYVYWP